MTRFLSFILFVLAFSSVRANDPVDHSSWDAMLKKYVSPKGKVNYKAWKSDTTALVAYLKVISANPPKGSWTSNQKKAYWMNAYNAYTVRLILDRYPVKSIKNIGGFIDPWKIKFFSIGGQKMDLNHIEHKILRVEFNDPRIHAGINCASNSFPRLSTTAFTGDNVEAELEKLMKEFVNDPTKNKIAADKIELSEIFNWFEKDFTKSGSLIDFLNKYSNTKISASAKKSFLKYDWNLNE